MSTYLRFAARLQTECYHYKMVAEEAFKQLQDIHGRHILSRSQSGRLHEWFELMEEVGEIISLVW